MSAGDAGRLSEAERAVVCICPWHENANVPDGEHRLACSTHARAVERILADRLAARQSPPGGVEAVLAEHGAIGYDDVDGCECGADVRSREQHRAHVAAALAPVLAAEPVSDSCRCDSRRPHWHEQGLAAERAAGAVAFADWVASNAAYNGSPDPGQAFYNDGLNPWLYEQAVRFGRTQSAQEDA